LARDFVFFILIIVGSCTNRHDWASLPSLAVETIVDCLSDGDVADFMRFRLVCKLWMSGNGTEKPCELFLKACITRASLREVRVQIHELRTADNELP
jgi:hypothetical protein